MARWSRYLMIVIQWTPCDGASLSIELAQMLRTSTGARRRCTGLGASGVGGVAGVGEGFASRPGTS